MILPNVTIKKILYATDLSESARYAFAYAVSLANHYGAGITILHVMDKMPNLDRNIVGYIDSDKWDEIKQQNIMAAQQTLIGKKRDDHAIRDALTRFCEEAREACTDQGVATDETLVATGNPVEEIIRQATERNCDVIVIGSHGHGTLVDAMLGTTAQRVLRRSPIPVLVVRIPDAVEKG